MSKTLQFLKSLITHWINAVSGTVLAVVLTFGPNFIPTQYLGWTQFVIALLAVLLACYLAWQEQYDANILLRTQLAAIQDAVPKYSVKIVDERLSMHADLEQMLKGKIKSAKENEQKAPSPNPFFPSLSILGEPTSVDWRKYIEELHTFQERLAVLKENAQGIINFEIKNIGRVSDESINMMIRFRDAEVIPHFYSKKIEIEMPSEPGLRHTFSSIGQPNKQGIKRETLNSTINLLEIEINRMHPDEVVNASYDPIFLKKAGSNPTVEYEIHSRNLPAPLIGTIKIQNS